MLNSQKSMVVGALIVPKSILRHFLTTHMLLVTAHILAHLQ
jgi:hypothetical protein